MSNTIGNILQLTSFGESHGKVIGGVLDGFPAGIEIDEDFIRSEMERRRPGQSEITTSRNETDNVEFLSGIYEGKTTGMPIAFIIPNKNQRSSDYDSESQAFRPSHADYTYYNKYGNVDHRGGGRSSARETAVRVVAGSLCKLAIKKVGITIEACTSQVGNIRLDKPIHQYDIRKAETNIVRCPDGNKAKRMIAAIREAKAEGDTVGGIVSCIIKGCPIGLGEPVYNKLHAALSQAMMSINAAKGFDYGSGFKGAEEKGSEQNDIIYSDQGKIRMRTNNSGGIQGGISNGEDIYFRVAFKPVATLLREQETVNKQGENIILKSKGRHDPCVVPRAVPIVEAMAAFVILDYYLLNKAKHI